MSDHTVATKKESTSTSIIHASKSSWEEKYEILNYYYEHYGYIRDSHGRFNEIIPWETQKWVRDQMNYFRYQYKKRGCLSQIALHRIEKFKNLGLKMSFNQVRVLVRFGQNETVRGGNVQANQTNTTACAVPQSSLTGDANLRPPLFATFPDTSGMHSIYTIQAGDETTIQVDTNNDELPPSEVRVAKHPGALLANKRKRDSDLSTDSRPIFGNITNQLPQYRPFETTNVGRKSFRPSDGTSAISRSSTVRPPPAPVATIDLTMNHIVPVKTEEEIPFFHHLQRLVKGLSMDDCDSLREIGINSKESLASVTDQDLMNFLPESSTKYVKAKQLYNIGLYFCKRGELKDDLEMMDVHVFNHEAQQK